jgi:hypothetical protein
MGYGRTATTWLQNKVFPVIPDFQYLGKTEQDFPQWMIKWNYLDRLLLSKEVKTIQGHIDQASEKGKVLISSEAFTQTGGIVDQIERIKAVIAEPKIILIIRNPTDLVVSKYRRLFEANFFDGEIEQYLDYSSTPFDLVRRKRLYLHDYNYPLVINRLFDEFGQQNVLVMKYEYLVNKPEAFIDVLMGFLCVDEQLDIDYLPINESNKKFFVEQKTIEKLEAFFSSTVNYESIPNCLITNPFELQNV